jgi:hydroxyacylglutathione hydrolase
MILHRFTVGPFAENCYVVGVPPRVAIVDPGGESEEIARFLERRGWRPEVVLLTHGHLDHIAHVAHVCERFAIGCRIHREDLWLLSTPQFPELEALLGARPCPQPEGHFADGEIVEAAGLALEVLHTPGHTPGGVCFLHRESRSMLVGDTLFQRGIGRTDLPGGDLATLARSIREQLFAVEGDWRLWPGHGPETTLEEERRENPFFGARAGAFAAP